MLQLAQARFFPAWELRALEFATLGGVDDIPNKRLQDPLERLWQFQIYEFASFWGVKEPMKPFLHSLLPKIEKTNGFILPLLARTRKEDDIEGILLKIFFWKWVKSNPFWIFGWFFWKWGFFKKKIFKSFEKAPLIEDSSNEIRSQIILSLPLYDFDKNKVQEGLFKTFNVKIDLDRIEKL